MTETPALRLRAVLFGAALAALSAACGGDGGPAAPQADDTPASIRITPSTPLTLPSGASATLAATAINSAGTAVSATITWATSDSAVATVSGGTVTARRTGTATITASAAGRSSTVVVTVTPGAASQLRVRTQPAGTSAGVALGTQPVVEVLDPAGNLVVSSTAVVTAALSAGEGTLSGSASVAAAAGVATFSGLTVSGSAGARRLTFTSPGLADATSQEFTLGPPPPPIIVLERSSVSIVAVTGGASSTPATVRISNGGVAALEGLALDAVEYASGAAWLSATLSSTTAPSTLTLSVTAGHLAAGTYQASVRIRAAAATNSPVTVPVTLELISGYTVTYGSASDRVRVLEVGAAYTPSLSVVDGSGRPVAGTGVAFTSRAGAVATVDSTGRVTARGPGDAWIVAGSTLSSDSVFVVVPRAGGGPVLRSTATNWSLRAGADTLVLNVVLDTRTTPVGAANVVAQVDWTGSLGFAHTAGTGPPAAVVSIPTTGVYRIAVGSATGMTGGVVLLTLRLRSTVVGTTGWVNLYALDVSAVDGSDLTAQATSTRIPFVFR